jgi:4-oxalocrotonate tautomerase
MPIIRVEIWKGKSAEVKKSIAQSLTKAMVESIGCQPQAVTVIIDEIPKADWFMGAKDSNELFPGIE